MNKKFTDISSVCVLILYLFLVARMFRNNIPLYILVLFFSVINITIVLSGHELGHLFFGKIFGFKLSSISFCGAEYNGYLKKWSYDFKQAPPLSCVRVRARFHIHSESSAPDDSTAVRQFCGTGS